MPRTGSRFGACATSALILPPAWDSPPQAPTCPYLLPATHITYRHFCHTLTTLSCQRACLVCSSQRLFCLLYVLASYLPHSLLLLCLPLLNMTPPQPHISASWILVGWWWTRMGWTISVCRQHLLAVPACHALLLLHGVRGMVLPWACPSTTSPVKSGRADIVCAHLSSIILGAPLPAACLLPVPAHASQVTTNCAWNVYLLGGVFHMNHNTSSDFMVCFAVRFRYGEHVTRWDVRLAPPHTRAFSCAANWRALPYSVPPCRYYRRRRLPR